MNNGTISNTITNIVSKELKLRREDVAQEKRLVEDLGADSLRKVECIMRIEEVFSIEISEHDSRQLSTVDDIICYVERKLSVSNQSG